MTLLIDVAFADVRADALRWALGLEARATLAATELALPDGGSVVLGVLGASHQVLVRDRAGRVRLSETVACDLPAARPLPGQSDEAGYRFASRVETLAPTDLADRVDALCAQLADDPRAVVATFPGTPYAVTALALDEPTPARLAWQTWHAYPQTGELVHTTTTLQTLGGGAR